MSTLNSSIRTPWSHAGDGYFAPRIEIIDHTGSPPVDLQPSLTTESPAEDDGPSSSQAPLSRKGTRSSGRTNLRKALEQRKYAKWTEARFSEEGARLSFASTASSTPSESEEAIADVQQTTIIRQVTTASSTLRKGPRKLKHMLTNRKLAGRSQEGNTAVDILYENQRGSFVFGYPLFSSRSLLNLDPAPWVTADGKPSPVDIRNAQVPDPSWKWSWKSWYVDMSRDVDEDGWEYSFSFQKRFAWHGTHPWFHSFVRRRRWLRTREKKDPREVRKTVEGNSLVEGHRLNADYFTIHPPKARPAESTDIDSTMVPTSHRLTEEDEEEDESNDLEEINNIPTLLRRLKHATIDREKQTLILQFLDQGGDELQLLPDHIPFLMSQFIFQYSRRQLLTKMLAKIDAAAAHRDAHRKNAQPEHDQETRRIDALLRAVEAADAQVQKLEYWSDVKQMVAAGDAALGADTDSGWDHAWTGVDSSGPAPAAEAPIATASPPAPREPSPSPFPSPRPSTPPAHALASDHEPDSDSAAIIDDDADDADANTPNPPA